MSEPAPMKCPSCKEQELEELVERETVFLGCTACFGLFVTEDDLASYVGRATGAEPVADAFRSLLDSALGGTLKPGIRRCPTCGDKLYRMGFGESPFVIIDYCNERHGIWLDKKELKKVIRSSRAQAAVMGLVPAQPDEPDEDD